MSRILGRHGVNIENLKAILGEMSEGHALFIFEVLVPKTTDLGAFAAGACSRSAKAQPERQHSARTGYFRGC